MGRSPLHSEQVPTALPLSMTTPEDPVSERLRKPDGAVVQDPPSIPAVPSQNRISQPITNSSHISGHRESTRVISTAQWFQNLFFQTQKIP